MTLPLKIRSILFWIIGSAIVAASILFLMRPYGLMMVFPFLFGFLLLWSSFLLLPGSFVLAGISMVPWIILWAFTGYELNTCVGEGCMGAAFLMIFGIPLMIFHIIVVTMITLHARSRSFWEIVTWCLLELIVGSGIAWVFLRNI